MWINRSARDKEWKEYSTGYLAVLYTTLPLWLKVIKLLACCSQFQMTYRTE